MTFPHHKNLDHIFNDIKVQKPAKNGKSDRSIYSTKTDSNPIRHISSTLNTIHIFRYISRVQIKKKLSQFYKASKGCHLTLIYCQQSSIARS